MLIFTFHNVIEQLYLQARKKKHNGLTTQIEPMVETDVYWVLGNYTVTNPSYCDRTTISTQKELKITLLLVYRLREQETKCFKKTIVKLIDANIHISYEKE